MPCCSPAAHPSERAAPAGSAGAPRTVAATAALLRCSARRCRAGLLAAAAGCPRGCEAGGQAVLGVPALHLLALAALLPAAAAGHALGCWGRRLSRRQPPLLVLLQQLSPQPPAAGAPPPPCAANTAWAAVEGGAGKSGGWCEADRGAKHDAQPAHVSTPSACSTRSMHTTRGAPSPGALAQSRHGRP